MNTINSLGRKLVYANKIHSSVVPVAGVLSRCLKVIVYAGIS